MIFRSLWIGFIVLLVAPRASSQTDLDLLPRRPEVVVRESKDGTLRFTVRGRDCVVADYLAAVAERAQAIQFDARADISGDESASSEDLTPKSSFSIVSDKAAERAIRSTLATVELYDRRAEQIVELLAAVAGVDFDVDAESQEFRLVGAARSGSRPLLRNAVEQFYKMALARQGDDETNARCLRGLADVLRESGDNAGAYAAYEQLITEHPTSSHSNDVELLLADCYIDLEQNARANQLLRSFLAKCTNPQRAELALRRLLGLLVDQERFHEIVTLHEAFERIGLLQGETLSAMADAAAIMLEESDADVVAFLLGCFRQRPEEHAMLGPVLGLAFQKIGDDESARIVLKRTSESIGSALDSTSALLAYGEISRRAGHQQAALLFAQRAVRSSQENPILLRRAHLLLADIYDALGVAPRVYRHLWEAEQLAEEGEAGRLALRAAEFAMERGEPEHARLLFQSAAHYSSVMVDAELGVARAFLLAGEDERALDHLREMLAVEPAGGQRERIEQLVAECRAKGGYYEDALEVIEGRADLSTDLSAGANDESPQAGDQP